MEVCRCSSIRSCILTILTISFIFSILSSLSFSLFFFFVKKKKAIFLLSIKFEDAKGNSRCEDSSLPTLLRIIFFLIFCSSREFHVHATSLLSFCAQRSDAPVRPCLLFLEILRMRLLLVSLCT